jgi:hypothetical protein
MRAGRSRRRVHLEPGTGASGPTRRAWVRPITDDIDGMKYRRLCRPRHARTSHGAGGEIDRFLVWRRLWLLRAAPGDLVITGPTHTNDFQVLMVLWGGAFKSLSGP